MEREEVLRRIREHLPELEQFDVRSISLFGSVARDEAGPASDVDVLVEFGQATFKGYMGVKFFLEDLLGTQVDVATAKGLAPRVLASAMREAVRVA
jgi:uncharacterized protein